MLSLHVFFVDNGFMLTFDMEMAIESVSRLMIAIAKATHVSVEKQVLLISTGEPLKPANRVASYPSVGTENNPIFLFSKAAIESNVPPSTSLNFGSELALNDEVERSLKMPPTYETVMSRDRLSAEFHRQAVEYTQTAIDLVRSQKLQDKGWAAVVLNLESIVSPFNIHLEKLRIMHKDFSAARPQYESMLNGFDEVISRLARIPILPCLHKSIFKLLPPENLLDWISVQDKKFSVMALVDHCSSLVKNFNDTSLNSVLSEMDKVEVQINEGSTGMRDIKGLNERLKSLDERLILMQKLLQDQEAMSQGFHQNSMRAQNLGDSSILPDLCSSHQKQLLVLSKNHQKIKEIYRVCLGSQDELSANLHKRLRWMMYIEKLICESDNKVLIYYENLQRIKKRLEVIEQVYEAPRMYVLAILEVLRRKNFSSQFLEWGRSVSQSANSTRGQEVDQRINFSHVFGNHFLQSLFPGLEDVPKPFAEEPPPLFDAHLPDVGIADLKLLQDNVPELLAELQLDICLDQSTYDTERLSQSSLTKLVDPNQNPTLEETLEFRKRTNIDSESRLTVSQLKREISCDQAEVDLSEKLVNSHIPSETDDIPYEEDFCPRSLGALPEHVYRHMINSSSSEGSDSMYKSANNEIEDTHVIKPIVKSEEDGNNAIQEDNISEAASNLETDIINSYETNRPTTETLSANLNSFIQDFKIFSTSCTNELTHVKADLLNTMKQCFVELNRLKTFDKLTQQEMKILKIENDDLKNEIKKLEGVVKVNNDNRTLKVDASTQNDCIKVIQADDAKDKEKVEMMEKQLQQCHQEISSLNSAKLQLEADQQSRFNAALIKIKKDKEASVKQLTFSNNKLEEQLKEIEIEKDDLQKHLLQSKEKCVEIEDRLTKELKSLTSKLTLIEECHMSEVEKLNVELNALQVTPHGILDTSIAESMEIVVDESQTNVVSPKASTASQVSVEEAVDALEWERLQEKLKSLQSENLQLKGLQNISDDSLKSQLLRARYLLRDKEEQCKSLHNSLAEYQVRQSNFLQFNQTTENVSLRSLDKTDVVAMIYDPLLKSCVVFSLDDTKYFIHPESMAALPFKSELESGKLKCFLAKVDDKEYCYTKKLQNHLKLPVGTYFWRLKISPIT